MACFAGYKHFNWVDKRHRPQDALFCKHTALALEGWDVLLRAEGWIADCRHAWPGRVRLVT